MGQPDSQLVNISTGLVEVQRTPDTIKNVTATGAGNTTLWTPNSGKRFRLLGYSLWLSGGATVAAPGEVVVTLRDTAAGTIIGQWAPFVGSALPTAETQFAISPPFNLPGNGYLGAFVNGALVINLGTALATGSIRASAWGCEE